jgi:hypothetical protein
MSQYPKRLIEVDLPIRSLLSLRPLAYKISRIHFQRVPGIVDDIMPHHLPCDNKARRGQPCVLIGLRIAR